MNTVIKNKSKNLLKKPIIELPTPSSISYIWNWGSLLGICLVTQLITGILLASHYNSDIKIAFESVISITRNINFGYEIRFIHINMARVFFVCIFVHIRRRLFNASFKLKKTWASGTTIILFLIATAFLGYVLPWGQISFWGATVITNLLSAIPYIGKTIVEWLWGGFSIEKATLSRFFSLHFITPIVLTAIVLLHIIFLHSSGSNKPTGNNNKIDIIIFHPFFSAKDLPSLVLMLRFLISFSFFSPFFLGDPENFNIANPLNTPIHIQPEWYFLFAYAILRSIPRKLGGVIALLISILLLYILRPLKKMKSTKKWIPNQKTNFWLYAATFWILTWAGAMPVEAPFENTRKTIRIVYFLSIVNL